MVYYGQRESTGGFQLWFRRYDDLQAAPIANAAGGADPAISPDGSEVVFQVGSELRVVPLGGGVPRTVVDSVFCCASWNPDGQSIFYTQAGNKVVRVPTDGGARELVLDATGEPNVAFFRVTPSGRSAVFTSFGNPTVVQGVELESGERTVLSEGLGARVTGNGHLVFASPAGELLAAPYAESPMRLTGAPVPLVAGVFVAGDGTPRFSLNEQGTLAYWEGEGNTGTELVWVTRDGAATHVDPNWTFNPGAGNRGWSLSPDGSKVEIRIATDAANNGALASMMSVNQPSSPASLGATTTNMPENPSNAATHRSQRMRSPKNQAAPSMTKMGPVNPMAVVSARPMRGRAMNHSIKAVVCTAPRHIWPLRLLGR